MKSEVYFTKFGASNFNDSILRRLETLFDRSGAGSIIKKNENVAVKAHFGEPGNVSFVSPVYYRTVIDRIKLCGGNPFVADTNTLYTGERNNAVKHLNAAHRQGFGYSSLGAPLIIADGLTGADFVEVPVDGVHLKKARIGSAFYRADSMIVMTHVKGHMMASVGGAIKNLSMGCACRAGKQEMHSGNKPAIKEKYCTSCGECVAWCGFGAISIENGKAQITGEKCSGCGECISVCRSDAITSNWDTDITAMHEKMAEYAAGAVANKKGKVFYLNFLMNITPECDCIPSSGGYLVPDIGILGSFDPVAIDKASEDLINQAPAIDYNLNPIADYDRSFEKTDKFRMVHPEIKKNTQLEHAVKMGMGSTDYEIIEI